MTTDKVSDAEVQETLEEVTPALGVLALQAETVMLVGVVAAITGVAVMGIEIPKIEMIETARVF